MGAGRVDVDRAMLRFGWEQLMASNIHPKHQELMRNLEGCNSQGQMRSMYKHVPISIQKAISSKERVLYFGDHI